MNVAMYVYVYVYVILITLYLYFSGQHTPILGKRIR